MLAHLKTIQISKYLKKNPDISISNKFEDFDKIKHTLVLKGHPPNLCRSPGLVSIRKEETWIKDFILMITIRKLPWSIHSEEVPSGLVETSATLCWFFAIGWVVTDRLSNWIFSYKVNFLDLKVTVYVL